MIKKTKNEILFILKNFYKLKIDDGWRYDAVKLIYNEFGNELGSITRKKSVPKYELILRGAKKEYSFIKSAYEHILLMERYFAH